MQNIKDDEEFLQEHRMSVAALLSNLILVDGKRVTVLIAIQMLAASFVSACREKNPELLKLPELIPIELHSEE